MSKESGGSLDLGSEDEEAPPSAQSRFGRCTLEESGRGGSMLDREDVDFVEESMRRTRAQETKTQSFKGKRKETPPTQVTIEEKEGGGGMVDSEEEAEEEEERIPLRGQSPTIETTSQMNFPQNHKKRSATSASLDVNSESPTSSTYLQAPTKRKKKGAEVDPLDEEFNKLKLAKERQVHGEAGPKTAMGGGKGAGEGGDGVTCKMVVVEVPLFRKPEDRSRRDQAVVDDHSVPNFKKFRKVGFFFVLSCLSILFLSGHPSLVSLSRCNAKRNPKRKQTLIPCILGFMLYSSIFRCIPLLFLLSFLAHSPLCIFPYSKKWPGLRLINSSCLLERIWVSRHVSSLLW